MGSNLDTTPALPPPAGETSNFVDPPSIQPAIIAGLTVCLAVSTASAIVRCYAQWTLFKRLVWADAWMLLGWLFHVAFAAFLYACLPYGAGRHQWDVSKEQFNQIEFLLFIDFVLYDIAILGGKVSILLQLKNIFAPQQHNRFYWSSLGLIMINIIFYIALSFALIFQCNPVARGWDPSVPGQCLDQDSLLESSGPFNIISDFLIFLLPIWAIWKLQLSLKKRMTVASAFAVGLFGCVCSAIRLYYSNRLDSSGDATYLIFQNQLWANAEIAVAILIANIIVVPRLIRHKRGYGSSGHTYHDSYNHQHTIGTFQSQRSRNADPYAELPGHMAMSELPSTHSKAELRDNYTLPERSSYKTESDREDTASDGGTTLNALPTPASYGRTPSTAIMRTVQIETAIDPAHLSAQPAPSGLPVGVAR